MTEPREPMDREDPISHAWKLLGIFLGLAALLAVSLPPLLRGEDPVSASGKAAFAFLALWALNRALALAFGLDHPHTARPDSPDVERSPAGE